MEAFLIRICPLLLRPKLLSVKNHWKQGTHGKQMRLRDGFLIAFGLLVMYGIYRGMLWMLAQAEADKTFVYLPPSLPLGLIFVYLMFMLFLSNGATAIASLYLSQDLDLILSSPIRSTKFVLGKMLDTLLSSSWITILFLIPALVSYGRYYHTGPSFYGMILLVLPPYFFIPSAFSILLVTIYSRFVAIGQTRVTRKLIGILGVLGLVCLGNILFRASTEFSFTSMDDVLRIVSILSLPNAIWLPSYWVSTSLSEILYPTKGTVLPYVLLLYAFSGALGCITFLVIRWAHFDAYSRACSHQQVRAIRISTEGRFLESLLSFLPRKRKALILKEYKSFSRDATQLFQLLLLSGICVLYFYNFRFIQGLQNGLPPERKVWWSIFSTLLNSYIESFLVAAVGTRFVFQSVSLEGSAFWLLQTSPLASREILRAKFWAWFAPITLILSVLFGVGVLAIGGSLTLVILKVFSTICVCYGVVGLGIGLGAYFANFQWEHPSQLAASFGSLVYMLAAVGLVSLSTGVLAALLVVRHYTFNEGLLNAGEYGIVVIGLLTLLFYLNFSVTRFCLELGEREIERRRE